VIKKILFGFVLLLAMLVGGMKAWGDHSLNYRLRQLIISNSVGQIKYQQANLAWNAGIRLEQVSFELVEQGLTMRGQAVNLDSLLPFVLPPHAPPYWRVDVEQFQLDWQLANTIRVNVLNLLGYQAYLIDDGLLKRLAYPGLRADLRLTIQQLESNSLAFHIQVDDPQLGQLTLDLQAALSWQQLLQAQSPTFWSDVAWQQVQLTYTPASLWSALLTQLAKRQNQSLLDLHTGLRQKIQADIKSWLANQNQAEIRGVLKAFIEQNKAISIQLNMEEAMSLKALLDTPLTHWGRRLGMQIR